MNITNRLFTYPVLSDEKDDFKSCVFEVDFASCMEGVNSLKLTFDVVMDCPEIEDMILKGQAEYVIHLECSTTAYREVLKSISKRIEHVIPIGRITGSFDVVAFVILKKNVFGYMCQDWDDDYLDMKFSLSQGSILAYQNLPGLNITKDFEEFVNAGSIFTVYKKISEDDKPIEVNLESNKIRIGLTTKDYDVYTTYAGKNQLQSIFHAMLVLPTLVFVFEELKQDGGEEQYHSKAWFIALEKSYAKRGLNFMHEVLNTDKNSITLAQEAMELPISKAFSQIPMFYDISEEEDA